MHRHTHYLCRIFAGLHIVDGCIYWPDSERLYLYNRAVLSYVERRFMAAVMNYSDAAIIDVLICKSISTHRVQIHRIMKPHSECPFQFLPHLCAGRQSGERRHQTGERRKRKVLGRARRRSRGGGEGRHITVCVPHECLGRIITQSTRRIVMRAHRNSAPHTPATSI